MRNLMRNWIATLLATAAVLALAATAAAQPQTQPNGGDAGEADGDGPQPLVVRGSAEFPWFHRAERTEGGHWFVLVDADTTLPFILEQTRFANRLYATTADRDENRRPISIRINRLNGLFLETAGLQANDVIHTCNDTPIARTMDLVMLARGNPLATEIHGEVSTEGEKRMLSCTLVRLPVRDGLTHQVAEGETLESIAAEYYGDERFYRLLVRENDLREPTLTVGSRLSLPHHPAMRYPAAQANDGMWLIPHHEHLPAIEDFASLLRQVRPLPARASDGRRGLRLAGPNRRALPFQRGLERGDIILSVNGVPMERGADVLAFYNDHRHLVFFELRVWRDDAEHTIRYCLLPAPDVSPEELQPPPTAAQPAEFGCERDADAEAALAASAPEGTQVIAWRVTTAQTRFLSWHFRELLRDAHLMPVLATPPGSQDGTFTGLRIRYADPDTLVHTYGFRAGDELQAVRIDDGEWQPVRAVYQLVSRFPIGLDATTIDFRLQRAGKPLWFRATLVPTPDGIDELPLRDSTGTTVGDGEDNGDK